MMSLYTAAEPCQERVAKKEASSLSHETSHRERPVEIQATNWTWISGTPGPVGVQLWEDLIVGSWVQKRGDVEKIAVRTCFHVLFAQVPRLNNVSFVKYYRIICLDARSIS